MRVVSRTAPLLLIGFALIGCSKQSSGKAASGNPPEPSADAGSPTVVLNIPSMH